MHPPGGPDLALMEWRAKLFLDRQRRKREERQKRIREAPNRIFPEDLLMLWIPFAVVSFLAIALVIGSILLPPLLVEWLRAADTKTATLTIAVTAILVSWAAWYLRESRRLKLYPVAEIALGTALAVQGVVQQNTEALREVGLIAAAVAFIAGVRITIDGIKRFHDYRTGWLLSRPGLKYMWRFSKRALRDSRLS